jgi:hypothetical protein
MQNSGDLAERVERLEKQNRRLKLIGGGVLFIAAVGLLIAAAAPAAPAKVIRAECFQAVDKNGKVRAELKGDPFRTLQFFDLKGKSPVRISAYGYEIRNAEDKRIAKFGPGVGGPWLTFYNTKGKICGSMYGNPERDMVTLSIKGKDGRSKMLTGSSITDGAYLLMVDPDGKVRISLRAGKRGAYFAIRDPEGKTQFRAPALKPAAPAEE